MDPRFRGDDMQKGCAENNRPFQPGIVRRILLHCKPKRPPLRRAFLSESTDEDGCFLIFAINCGGRSFQKVRPNDGRSLIFAVRGWQKY